MPCCIQYSQDGNPSERLVQMTCGLCWAPPACWTGWCPSVLHAARRVEGMACWGGKRQTLDSPHPDDASDLPSSQWGGQLRLASPAPMRICTLHQERIGTEGILSFDQKLHTKSKGEQWPTVSLLLAPCRYALKPCPVDDFPGRRGVTLKQLRNEWGWSLTVHSGTAHDIP